MSLEIQKVFNLGFEKARIHYNFSDVKLKAARDIMDCRTQALGYNASVCPDCGNIEIHSNSCRNRNCPCCQSVATEIWIDARKAEVINASYFHVVMTVPAELNCLFYANQKTLYSLLHQCSAQSMLEIAANPKHLGAVPGIIQVLHTWGQKLNYHPHIHAIVSGAGLSKSCQLRKCGDHFFIPLKKLMRKFRGKFMCRFNHMYECGSLHIPSSCSDLLDPSVWKSFVNKLYNKEWAPYIKETFNGFGNALDYIGRYTHRVAISNNRIKSVSDSHVTFSARDYRTGKIVEITLEHAEFVRRFLMHILPSGFQKIRYYGFLSNRHKKRNLSLIVKLTGKELFRSLYAGLSKTEIILLRWNFDFRVCRICGCCNMSQSARYFSDSG